MSTDNFVDRLKLFMSESGIASTAFADKCGIPRPSFSQIINGRNKKINDQVVSAIHGAFPELSVMWLLFGEGNMLTRSDDKEGAQDASFSPADLSVGGVGDMSFVGDPFSASGGRSVGSVSVVHDFEDPAPYGNSNFADTQRGESIFKAQNPSLNPKYSAGCSVGSEYGKENRLKILEKALKESENKVVELANKNADLQLQIEKNRQNPRRVVQITVFYDDSTFETFRPE